MDTQWVATRVTNGMLGFAKPLLGATGRAISRTTEPSARRERRRQLHQRHVILSRRRRIPPRSGPSSYPSPFWTIRLPFLSLCDTKPIPETRQFPPKSLTPIPTLPSLLVSAQKRASCPRQGIDSHLPAVSCISSTFFQPVLSGHQAYFEQSRPGSICVSESSVHPGIIQNLDRLLLLQQRDTFSIARKRQTSRGQGGEVQLACSNQLNGSFRS